MAKIAEKLLILLDINKGLLARTHHLVLFEKPAILDVEIEKVCTRIRKKWPSTNELLEKVMCLEDCRTHSP